MPTAISADGTVIGYDSVGVGPPLLLVHGSTGTRARWSSVTPRLARRYTVHAMDRRGRGLSAAEAGPYSLKREAEDVAAVAEAVGGDVYGDVYVVGHSSGALAVLEAALITPAFRRIVLYEPPMPSPGHQVSAPDVCARIRAMSDPRQILAAFYRETLHLAPSAVEDLSKRELPYVADSIRHTAARELAEASAYRATRRLSGISVPVRILLGTESPEYLRAAAEVLAARIPGATTVALLGQGHQAVDYDPRQFTSAVMEFDAPDVYSVRVAASVPPSS